MARNSRKLHTLAVAALAAFGLLGASGSLGDEKPYAGPSIADIMGQTQLRHIKLGYAGKATNWRLAAYEVEQIRRSFAHAAETGGDIEGKPMKTWVDEETLPPLAEIDKAITAKDVARFSKAFEKLTEACNKCHVAANIGFVKMQVPTASPFSNQSFPP